MNILKDNTDSSRYFEKGLKYLLEHPIKKGVFKGEYNFKINEEFIYLIATTKVTSQDWLKEEIKLIYDKSNGDLSKLIVVIVDYFKDSMIQKKYMQSRVFKGLKVSNSPKWIYLEYMETDTILMIEDEYNHEYNYKSLSRHYKKQLLNSLLLSCVDDEKNNELETNTLDEKVKDKSNSKKKTHKRGKKYADSSVV